MSEERGRIGRTVRLTPDINSRLLALCEHLGTNPNAYLVTEIGKAIARDEIQLRSIQGQQNLMAQITEVFAREMASKEDNSN